MTVLNFVIIVIVILLTSCVVGSSGKIIMSLVGARLNDSSPLSFGTHERLQISYAHRVVLMVFLTVVITFTVGGNLMTIVVMRLDKRLRSQPVSSLYIASLAGADLLVGSVVMTFMLLYTITFNGRWVFGSVMCTIWTCVDYLSCTASLTNVFLIAVDRYRSVSQPLKAMRRRTRRRASLFLLMAWLVPAFFWISVICLMRVKTDARRPLDRNDSFVPLSKKPEYDMSVVCDTKWDPPELAVVGVVIMFYIPLAAILILFGLIMCVLRRHMIAMTGRRTLSLGNDSSDDAAACRQRDDLENLVSEKSRRVTANATATTSTSTTATTTTASTICVQAVDVVTKETNSPTLTSCLRTNRKRPFDKRRSGSAPTLQRTNIESTPSIRICSRNSETRIYAPRDHSEVTSFESKEGSSTCSDSTREPLHWARNMHYEVPRYQRYASQLRAQRQDSLQEVRLRQQIKAARILGAITGFLLLCWIPFSVMLAIKAFCSDCLSQRTFDIAIWINYINSGINPIIYCLCNSQYRQAFLKLARRVRCSCLTGDSSLCD